MAEITASLVKELRDKTGAGMMDCKRALGECEGDIEGAYAARDAMNPLRNIREDIYSVLWNGDRVEHPTSYLKYWQELMGYASGPPRPPLKELSDEGKKAFREKLYATGLMEQYQLDAPAVEASARVGVPA